MATTAIHLCIVGDGFFPQMQRYIKAQAKVSVFARHSCRDVKKTRSHLTHLRGLRACEYFAQI